MGSWPTNVKISHENLAKFWDITSLDIVQKKSKTIPQNGEVWKMAHLVR
jgi:hypothetical protein